MPKRKGKDLLKVAKEVMLPKIDLEQGAKELGALEIAKLPEMGKAKFKRSGHLADQMLKYNYPDKGPQLSIFPSLLPETKKDIEVTEVEVTEIIEGIKLSPAQTKLIDSLCKFLHETSQTSDPNKQNYYAGGAGYELVSYLGEQTPEPKLGITLYELTKEYKGGEDISGKDVENVKKILTELDTKRFLIKYTETTKGRNGEWKIKEYEAFRPLIYLDKATLRHGVGNVEQYKKTETIILLHPIFRRQISSKFLLYPTDINGRTIKAYGSHNLSEAALRLRDYLIREISSKRYTVTISLEKLYYLLAEKWMRESRKKKVKEYTDKALETVKALGILLSYKKKIGATGETIIVFELNKDWE
jgi:hypothetical protein